MKHFYIFAAFFLVLVAQAEFRIWEDADGNIWEGEFVTMSAGEVVMRDQQDKRIRIVPENLCEADQRYLEKVVPPKLAIDVSKTTDNARSGSNSEQVRCTVAIKQTDTRPYTGELTAVLLTMGEDIRTGSTSQVNRKEHTFTLPQNRGDAVEFRGDSASFLRKSNKAGRTYSGYILVVWDRFGNPVAVAANRSSFEENATTLARPKMKQKSKS